MQKFLVAFIFTSLCGLSAWYLANPDMWNQRALVIRDAGSALQQDVVNITSGLSIGVPEAPSSFTEGSSEVSCRAPSTRGVARREPTVYRWTDADGQLHFSDENPGDVSAERYSVAEGGGLDYFDLAIDFRGGSMVPFLDNQLGSQATSIYEIMTGLVGSENLRRVQLNVVIFPDEPAFHRYAKASGVNSDGWSGYYSTRTNEAVTYTAADDVRTMEVAKHESSHVIARGIMGALPIWLNEGLADYFAQMNIKGQYSEISIDEEALRIARATLNGGYPANFADFLHIEQESWRARYETNHYALAWSLVYYMMGTDAGRESLANMMRQMAENYCQPFDTAAALARSYPGGLNALERELRTWLNDDATKSSHIY